MKLTVAFVGYRRLEYTEAATEALLACHGFKDIVEKIVTSTDDAMGLGVLVSHHMQRLSRRLQPDIFVENMNQRRQRGIVGNTILAMKRAFDGGAQSVLMLEDDAVLKPDALLLAQWFANRNDISYVAFGLSAHGPYRVPRPPELLTEFNYLPCPFAYVINKHHYEFVLKNWCCKEYHPCGWSWSMTYASRFQGLKFLGPQLSRVENIGREAGTNESPESWDESQRGLPFSDGSYRGPYIIGETITEEQTREISPWMQPEIDKDGNQKFDAWVGHSRPEELG